MHNIITNSKVVAEELGISSDDNMNIEKDKIERILGMHWASNIDCFVLKFHKVPKNILELIEVPTKRQLLSITMSIFDPFGFVADFMVIVKILMQEVWRSGIDWETKLPNDIYEKLKFWLNDLHKITQYKIPRFYFKEHNNINKIELPLFSDASEEALAAVSYWRIVSELKSEVVFITGKTTCAPMRYHS